MIAIKNALEQLILEYKGDINNLPIKRLIYKLDKAAWAEGLISEMDQLDEIESIFEEYEQELLKIREETLEIMEGTLRYKEENIESSVKKRNLLIISNEDKKPIKEETLKLNKLIKERDQLKEKIGALSAKIASSNSFV